MIMFTYKYIQPKRDFIKFPTQINKEIVKKQKWTTINSFEVSVFIPNTVNEIINNKFIEKSACYMKKLIVPL